jgi:16S rRNA G527 N7-methylase RsmG
MSDESLIAKTFLKLEENQTNQLARYAELLGEWNEKLILFQEKIFKMLSVAISFQIWQFLWSEISRKGKVF